MSWVVPKTGEGKISPSNLYRSMFDKKQEVLKKRVRNLKGQAGFINDLVESGPDREQEISR